MTTPERQLEEHLIETLRGLKYDYRADIRDRAALEKNFREKFETLNHVHLTNGEFQRLLDEIVTPDVFTAAHTLRNRSSFTRDDGTPLNYTLVNIADWCKNTFEGVSQLRINTDNSHRRYDVILLINGIPAVQIELKSLGINPRRAIEQIVEYKNDPGNGYVWHTTGSGKTLTSFKASTLLKANPSVDKCLFVVDRKDLDRQTHEEFNRFQEGCVEENTNTRALVNRLLSDGLLVSWREEAKPRPELVKARPIKLHPEPKAAPTGTAKGCKKKPNNRHSTQHDGSPSDQRGNGKEER